MPQGQEALRKGERIDQAAEGHALLDLEDPALRLQQVNDKDTEISRRGREVGGLEAQQVGFRRCEEVGVRHRPGGPYLT